MIEKIRGSSRQICFNAKHRKKTELSIHNIIRNTSTLLIVIPVCIFDFTVFSETVTL